MSFAGRTGTTNYARLKPILTFRGHTLVSLVCIPTPEHADLRTKVIPHWRLHAQPESQSFAGVAALADATSPWPCALSRN